MAFKYSSMKPYERPADLQKNVNSYFKMCEETETAPTMSGLALYLHASLKAVQDWAKMPEFAAILDEAFLRVEHWLENELVTREGRTDGIQHALDNRFGWRDKKEYELGKDSREAAAAALPLKQKLEIIEAAQKSMLEMQAKMALSQGTVKPAVEAEFVEVES